MIIVPLVSGDEVVGAMNISRLGGAEVAFTEADFELVQLFAGQAAVAITNARLYEQLRERIDAQHPGRDRGPDRRAPRAADRPRSRGQGRRAPASRGPCADQPDRRRGRPSRSADRRRPDPRRRRTSRCRSARDRRHGGR